MAAIRGEAGGRPVPQQLWERWEPLVWDGLFYACLALPTLLAAVAAPSRSSALLTVALAVAFGAWHWLLAIRDRDLAEHIPMAVWLLGVLVFTAVLTGRDGVFMILIWGLYPQLFILLGRWAVPGAVVLTVLVSWRMGAFAEGRLTSGTLSVVVSTVVAVLVGYSLRAVARQSEQRKAALEALEATRAELAATSRRAGALEERARVAREVHDTIAQRFTGILLQLEACEQALEADRGTARAHLDRARHSARDSLGEVRRAVHALRPRPLEDVGLAEALRRTVTAYRRETGAAAEFVSRGQVRPLAPDAEVALLRAVQEGLANAAKHAPGAPVQVTLDYTGPATHLSIADDGPGFDPRQPSDGMGLQGMRERIDALGGSFAVSAGTGTGTRIDLTVPAS